MLTEGASWLHLLACYPLTHTEKKKSPPAIWCRLLSLSYDISLMLMTYLMSYVLYLIYTFEHFYFVLGRVM